MNNKIIIDINENNNDSFVLNLKNIDSLNSIHLNKEDAIVECEQAIEKRDFKKAKDLLELSIKLSSYGDNSIDELKDKFYGYKIIYLYDYRNNTSIEFYLSILLEINKFFSIIHSQINLELNEELNYIINKLSDIIKEIDIKNVIQYNIENIKDNDVSIKGLEYIERYREENNSTELKESLDRFYKTYELEIDNEIKNICKLPLLEQLSKIKQILKEVYDNSFFETQEFANLILRTRNNGYENYKTLLDLINKEYLVYRFNNEKNLEKKKYLLYSELLSNYVELPIIYKEYVIEKLVEMKNKYIDFEKLSNTINDIIKEIGKNQPIKFIPI